MHCGVVFIAEQRLGGDPTDSVNLPAVRGDAESAAPLPLDAVCRRHRLHAGTRLLRRRPARPHRQERRRRMVSVVNHVTWPKVSPNIDTDIDSDNL